MYTLTSTSKIYPFVHHFSSNILHITTSTKTLHILHSLLGSIAVACCCHLVFSYDGRAGRMMWQMTKMNVKKYEKECVEGRDREKTDQRRASSSLSSISFSIVHLNNDRFIVLRNIPTPTLRFYWEIKYTTAAYNGWPTSSKAIIPFNFIVDVYNNRQHRIVSSTVIHWW